MKKTGIGQRNWNDLAYKLTGEPMCMRGAFLTGSICPASAAQEHEKIRSAMMYEFYRRFERDLQNVMESPPSKRLMEKLRKE